MTAADAIQTSIDEDRLVDLEFSPEAFDHLSRKCSGHYVLTRDHFEFQGGDESARNDWFVRLERKR